MKEKCDSCGCDMQGKEVFFLGKRKRTWHGCKQCFWEEKYEKTRGVVS